MDRERLTAPSHWPTPSGIWYGTLSASVQLALPALFFKSCRPVLCPKKMDVLEVPANRQKGWYLSLMAPNTKGPAFAWLDPSRLYCNPQVRPVKAEVSRRLVVTPFHCMTKRCLFWVHIIYELVCSGPRLLQTVWKTSSVHLTATPLTWLLGLMQWDLFLVRNSAEFTVIKWILHKECSWAAA